MKVRPLIDSSQPDYKSDLPVPVLESPTHPKLVKKHQKGNPQEDRPGGIIEKEMPIPYSNAILQDKNTGKGCKVGFKILEDGRKVRYSKVNNELIDS